MCPAEIRKSGQRKERIRLQNSLPCPLRKQKIGKFYSLKGLVYELNIFSTFFRDDEMSFTHAHAKG